MAPPLPGLERFQRIYLADYEYARTPGDPPRPIGGTYLELRTGQLHRAWLFDGRGADQLPPLGPDALYISYHLPAELICRQVLGLPLPAHCLDLAVEYRLKKNGLPPGMGRGLVAALLDHGI